MAEDPRERARRLALSFKRTLVSGLFIVGPLSLTFILLAWFVSTVDSALAPVIGIIGRPVPGLGLLVALLIVLGAGMLGSHVAGQHVLEVVEDVVLKVPGFNWLYRTIKQLSDVFSPAASAASKHFVIVEYPRKGVYRFAFLTKDRLTVRDGSSDREFVGVFLPTNHLYIGDYVLVPQEDVLHTDLTQQQGVQAALSAGASLPDVLRVSRQEFGARSEERAP